MRTTIELDEALVERARSLTGIKTKRGVINESLRMLIQLHEQARVRELRGKLRWEDNLDSLGEQRSHQGRLKKL